jgi:hypothetical protein
LSKPLARVTAIGGHRYRRSSSSGCTQKYGVISSCIVSLMMRTGGAYRPFSPQLVWQMDWRSELLGLSSQNLRRKALRAKTNFLNGFKLIWPVQRLLKKYSDFQNTQISPYLQPSHPDRGALANVINVGRAAVDAEGASDKGA